MFASFSSFILCPFTKASAFTAVPTEKSSCCYLWGGGFKGFFFFTPEFHDPIRLISFKVFQRGWFNHQQAILSWRHCQLSCFDCQMTRQAAESFRYLVPWKLNSFCCGVKMQRMRVFQKKELLKATHCRMRYTYILSSCQINVHGRALYFLCIDNETPLRVLISSFQIIADLCCQHFLFLGWGWGVDCTSLPAQHVTSLLRPLARRKRSILLQRTLESLEVQRTGEMDPLIWKLGTLMNRVADWASHVSLVNQRL